MNGRAADFRAWLEKAAEDPLCIENEMRAERKPWSVICFCAQQVAEKYLKAFLAHQGKQPERIHDLSALLSECVKHDQTLAELEDDCRALNSYAVDIRYPDIGIQQTDFESITREAIGASNRICTAVLEHLPK